MSAALPASGREWHLVARPHGWPKAEDFALRISSSADGQEAVDRLLDFAKALSAATVRS